MMNEEIISQNLQEINRKISTIEQLLKGHEMDIDDKGMVGAQNDHEKRIRAIEKVVNNGKYFLAGLAVPAGWGIIDIVTKIFIK